MRIGEIGQQFRALRGRPLRFLERAFPEQPLGLGEEPRRFALDEEPTQKIQQHSKVFAVIFPESGEPV